MAAWSEPARLDLAIVLRHLGRFEEARTALLTAQHALIAHGHPRHMEATTELAALGAARAGRGV